MSDIGSTLGAASRRRRLGARTPQGLVLWDIKVKLSFIESLQPIYMAVKVRPRGRRYAWSTVEHAMDLLARVETLSGGVPHVMLVNKLISATGGKWARPSFILRKTGPGDLYLQRARRDKQSRQPWKPLPERCGACDE
jgi:hypothetical protein